MQNGFLLIWHIVGPQHIIAVWFDAQKPMPDSCSRQHLGCGHGKQGRVLESAPSSVLSLAGLAAPHLQLRSKPLAASQKFPPFACAPLSGLKSPRPLPPPISF